MINKSTFKKLESIHECCSMHVLLVSLLLNLDRYLPIPENKYLLKVGNRNTRKKV